jgi:hypothetical protein
MYIHKNEVTFIHLFLCSKDTFTLQQATKAQGGSRCTALLSLTLAPDGVGSTPCPSCFTHGKDPVPIVYESGWKPGPVWKSAENLAPIRIQSPGCQTVVSHYTNYAIPAHFYVVLYAIPAHFYVVLTQKDNEQR